MQVLVALARAEGEVVTRDDLIASCWSGVVVGDNAIHRTISRLREIAESFGPDAFQIATIARVGYRLSTVGTPDVELGRAAGGVAPAGVPPPPTPPWLQRRTVVIAAGAALGIGLIAGAGWFALRGAAPATPILTVVIEGEGGADAVRLARAVEMDTPRLVDGSPLQVSFAEPGRGIAQGYRVRVTDETEGATLRAGLRVVGADDGELLWSESLERPTAQAAGMASELASRLAAVLNCADQAGTARPALDAATLRTFVAACERLPGEADASVLSLLRSVTAQRPDFAAGLAWQAFSEAELAASRVGSPQDMDPQNRALRAAAAADLQRARDLKARDGVLWLAQATLFKRPQWREALAALDRGVAADPDYGPLYRKRSVILQSVGRLADAVQDARRAVALGPLDADAREALVLALAYEGRTDAARLELEAAEQVWPDLELIHEARANFDVRFGDPVNFMRAVDVTPVGDSGPLEAYHVSYRSYAAARAAPTPAHIDVALRDGAALARLKPGSPWLMQLYGYYNRVDDAYAMLDQPGALIRIGYASDTLFRPYMRSVRFDPRFMTLAAQLGLAAYWRQTGRWPDFCVDKALPYDCRTEAAKAERALVNATRR